MLDPKTPHSATSIPEAAASSVPQTATALVVDDSAPMRRATVALLESMDIFGQVLSADDGLSAIAAMRRHHVDIVLCDMHMERCDGLRFLSLKAAEPTLTGIPVIMRTGDDDIDTMVRAFGLGAHDYVAKTAAGAELRARLTVHLELKRATDELRMQRAQLELLTRQDSLTGLANRRKFDELLSLEVGRATRYGRPMSIVMIDLDRFKEINDTHGHQAGDHVLREAAEILRRSVRKQDMVARYGGEEIAILMPETPMPHAALVAERLRIALASAAIPWRGVALRVTASFGVIGSPGMPVVEPAEMVRLADRAMYRAKSLGRNRVALARPDSGPTAPAGQPPVGQA